MNVVTPMSKEYITKNNYHKIKTGVRVSYSDHGRVATISGVSPGPLCPGEWVGIWDKVGQRKGPTISAAHTGYFDLRHFERHDYFIVNERRPTIIL